MPNACKRIHAFATDLDEAALDTLLCRASAGEYKEVREQLQASYRGFVVVRPLPAVPIGRTVLACPEDLGTRKYESTVDYPVHFLGFELSVHGIAFQQQDVAVGSCATTAIWTALQRAARHEGGRAPTPSAITQAAARYLLREGRPMPGHHGLTLEQICEAFRAFDFAPEVIHAGKSEDALVDFRRFLNIYLRSGIPVTLSLGGDRGHAVTVVGYRQSSSKAVPVVTQLPGEPAREFIYLNDTHDRLFVHDDQIGPYASATLEAQVAPSNYQPILQLSIKLPADDKGSIRPIRSAIVPLYPKLRCNAKNLVEHADELLPPIHEVVTIKNGHVLALELLFMRSGSYTASLYERHLDPLRVMHFQKSVSMSRYIGLARWYADDRKILDAIWDTTDIRRKSSKTRPCEALLAVVALDPAYQGFADGLANGLGILSG